MASALVFSGLAALAGSGWAHASESITTMEGLTTCLTTNNSTCILGGDIAVNGIIDIPESIKTSLDLNGHRLYENESQALLIENHGDLAISDSSTTIGSCDATIKVKDNGKLEISNGTFNDEVKADTSVGGVSNTSIKISGGVFNKFVSAIDKGTVDISNGVFNDSVSFGYNNAQVSATISGGTFHNVYNSSGASMVINSGTFDKVSSNGNDTINDGTFKGTLFVGDPGSSLVINGGTFSDINAINYEEGSSLTITGGKFTEGFSIGLENVSITGGTFYNGATESDGWMSLHLEHPDTQKYSITGGTFLNTGDDNGVLMKIKTITRPTLASIQSLFTGGTVLNGTVIELDKSENLSAYWSYIKKQKTDADGDIAVPDTGSVTKSGDELKAIGGIVAAAVMLFTAGSFMVFKSRKELFRKKVGFNKK